MADVAAIDAFAARVRPFYGRFLDHLGDEILMTGHSHQAWPDVSRDAQLAAWDDAARLADRKWGRIFGAVLPEFQRRVASRLGTNRHDDLAIAPNTHELVYRFASCFSGAHSIVSTDSEFHSLTRQLDRFSEEGTRIVRVEGEAPDFVDRFIQAVRREKPTWAALSYVLFTTSRVIAELPRVLEVLDELSIPVLVDVYHGFNALPLEVDSWPGPPFVTGGGYKYAETGEGAAWMLLPPDAQALRPRSTGWFADFAHLEGLQKGPVPYGRGGQRFLGATFDPSGIYRGTAVLRWMDDLGLDCSALRHQSLAQTELIFECFDELGLDSKGIVIATPRASHERGAFVAFRTPRAQEHVSALNQRGIRADARGDLLRFGPAPYTTSTDIRRAMHTLATVC